jgi:hypothetical protein
MFGRSRVRSLGVALAILLPLVSGCERETVVGIYQASTFTYTQSGGSPVDALAAGGKINLTVHNDFTTSGTLVVPGSVVMGSDVSSSLLGNAVVQRDTVTFNLVAESFMRDTPFVFDGKTLTGTRTASGVTVHVVLTK